MKILVVACAVSVGRALIAVTGEYVLGYPKRVSFLKNNLVEINDRELGKCHSTLEPRYGIWLATHR